MASKKTDDSGKNKPFKKVKAGRFQISLWKFKRLLNSGNSDSVAYIEQWVDVERACIQHTTYNRVTGQRENQQIWCSRDDLWELLKVAEQT